MATSTVEDYLKCILVEEQKNPGGLVPTGVVAKALEVLPGTATSMVKTLAEAKLVRYEPYSGVALSESGRKLATHVLRRHRLIELFLVQVLKLDWTEVHEEAELLEHAVSDRLIDRIDEMLGRPEVDPHGDPIPTAEGAFPALVTQSLVHCSVETPLEVVRVDDQSADFLQLIEQQGLKPGTVIRVARRNDIAESVEVDGVGDGGPKRASLGYSVAAKVHVRPVAG